MSTHTNLPPTLNLKESEKVKYNNQSFTTGHGYELSDPILPTQEAILRKGLTDNLVCLSGTPWYTVTPREAILAILPSDNPMGQFSPTAPRVQGLGAVAPACQLPNRSRYKSAFNVTDLYNPLLLNSPLVKVGDTYELVLQTNRSKTKQVIDNVSPLTLTLAAGMLVKVNDTKSQGDFTRLWRSLVNQCVDAKYAADVELRIASQLRSKDPSNKPVENLVKPEKSDELTACQIRLDKIRKERDEEHRIRIAKLADFNRNSDEPINPAQIPEGPATQLYNECVMSGQYAELTSMRAAYEDSVIAYRSEELKAKFSGYIGKMDADTEDHNRMLRDNCYYMRKTEHIFGNRGFVPECPYTSSYADKSSNQKFKKEDRPVFTFPLVEGEYYAVGRGLEFCIFELRDYLITSNCLTDENVQNLHIPFDKVENFGLCFDVSMTLPKSCEKDEQLPDFPKGFIPVAVPLMTREQSLNLRKDGVQGVDGNQIKLGKLYCASDVRKDSWSKFMEHYNDKNSAPWTACDYMRPEKADIIQNIKLSLTAFRHHKGDNLDFLNAYDRPLSVSESLFTDGGMYELPRGFTDPKQVRWITGADGVDRKAPEVSDSAACQEIYAQHCGDFPWYREPLTETKIKNLLTGSQVWSIEHATLAIFVTLWMRSNPVQMVNFFMDALTKSPSKRTTFKDLTKPVATKLLKKLQAIDDGLNSYCRTNYEEYLKQVTEVNSATDFFNVTSKVVEETGSDSDVLPPPELVDSGQQACAPQAPTKSDKLKASETLKAEQDILHRKHLTKRNLELVRVNKNLHEKYKKDARKYNELCAGTPLENTTFGVDQQREQSVKPNAPVPMIPNDMIKFIFDYIYQGRNVTYNQILEEDYSQILKGRSLNTVDKAAYKEFMADCKYAEEYELKDFALVFTLWPHCQDDVSFNELMGLLSTPFDCGSVPLYRMAQRQELQEIIFRESKYSLDRRIHKWSTLHPHKYLNLGMWDNLSIKCRAYWRDSSYLDRYRMYGQHTDILDEEIALQAEALEAGFNAAQIITRVSRREFLPVSEDLRCGIKPVNSSVRYNVTHTTLHRTHISDVTRTLVPVVGLNGQSSGEVVVTLPSTVPSDHQEYAQACKDVMNVCELKQRADVVRRISRKTYLLNINQRKLSAESMRRKVETQCQLENDRAPRAKKDSKYLCTKPFLQEYCRLADGLGTDWTFDTSQYHHFIELLWGGRVTEHLKPENLDEIVRQTTSTPTEGIKKVVHTRATWNEGKLECDKVRFQYLPSFFCSQPTNTAKGTASMVDRLCFASLRTGAIKWRPLPWSIEDITYYDNALPARSFGARRVWFKGGQLVNADGLTPLHTVDQTASDIVAQEPNSRDFKISEDETQLLVDKKRLDDDGVGWV